MASSSCAATPSCLITDRERVIGELTRGREFADKLRLVLRGAAAADGGASAQDLLGRIVDTFTQSISVLCAGGDSDEVSQVPAVVDLPVLKTEDSGESCKTPASKDRRGCYKRKKTSETRIKDSPTTVDDGHAWRKYGQKTILNAKFPRNYFRCTHKFDQGCQASKQVQQIQEDPPLFRTTYHGTHTCKNQYRAAHPIIIDATTPDSSVIWNFQPQQEPAAFNEFAFDSDKSTIKRENEDEYRVGSSDFGPGYYLAPDLFDAEHLGGFSSGSDHGEAVSCTASTHSMDMDASYMSYQCAIGRFFSLPVSPVPMKNPVGFCVGFCFIASSCSSLHNCKIK